MTGSPAIALAQRWVDDPESLDSIDFGVLTHWVIERANVYRRKYKRADASSIAHHMAESLTIEFEAAWQLCERIRPSGWA
jgi:hypothetical protein